MVDLSATILLIAAEVSSAEATLHLMNVALPLAEFYFFYRRPRAWFIYI
jgi:hypothetical protein